MTMEYKPYFQYNRVIHSALHEPIDACIDDKLLKVALYFPDCKVYFSLASVIRDFLVLCVGGG